MRPSSSSPVSAMPAAAAHRDPAAATTRADSKIGLEPKWLPMVLFLCIRLDLFHPAARCSLRRPIVRTHALACNSQTSLLSCYVGIMSSTLLGGRFANSVLCSP